MKKLFSIIVTAALSAALLAGCGAKKTASNNSTSSGLKDGTYKAESKVDERGYKKTIELTVASGKISKVVYDEVSKDGKKKSEDAEYKKNWQTKLKDADPKAFYEKLAADLVAKQDVDKVDAITGATSATNGFKEMAKEALKQAK